MDKVFLIHDATRLGVKDKLVQRCENDNVIREVILFIWLLLLLQFKFQG